MRHLILFISHVLFRTVCGIVDMRWYGPERLLILTRRIIITVSLASTFIG